jgi:FtsH-binding integral membrane protein
MFSKFNKLSTISKFNKFSSKNFAFKIKESLSNPSVGYALLGLGVGGLAYLMYNHTKAHSNNVRALIHNGQKVRENVALQRTRETVGYFTGGLALTTLLTAFMLRSPKILTFSSSMSSLLFILPTNIFCTYMMYSTPNNNQSGGMKHLYWLGFNSVMAFTIVPIIYASQLVVIRDAFLLTSGAMGGLGLVAMNSRDDAFLNMGGVLGAGLGAITVIGIANLFLKSHGLYNIWLWGGLALFTAFTLYDMKVILAKARNLPYYDSMNESIKVYLDFINIFIRLLAIMGNRKN